MEVDILCLFPDYFKGPFDESMIKRARAKKLVDIRLVNIRDFTQDPRRRVDERPYGGGPGMVMTPQPIVDAVRSVKKPDSKIVYLSPQGSLLTAAKCRELAQCPRLILLCGHYEGIDERIFEMEDFSVEEISIGDYVLTNGGLAALVLLDATIRHIPGVLGHPLAAEEDSFEKGILDCPHYTRPEIFEGKSVPPVLLSGNHAEIAKWRQEQARKKTKRVRPDLLKMA